MCVAISGFKPYLHAAAAAAAARHPACPIPRCLVSPPTLATADQGEEPPDTQVVARPSREVIFARDVPPPVPPRGANLELHLVALPGPSDPSGARPRWFVYVYGLFRTFLVCFEPISWSLTDRQGRGVRTVGTQAGSGLGRPRNRGSQTDETSIWP